MSNNTEAAKVATFDDVDLSMVMAVVADGVGCEDDTAMVECTEVVALSGDSGGLVWYSFSAAATEVLAAAARDDTDEIDWLMIATVPLVEDLVAEVGEAWRPEAEVVADAVMADRADRLAAIAALAAAGPVGFSTEVEAAKLLAVGFPNIDLASLI